MAVLRKILFLPALRYVDDIFGPDREGSVAHAKQLIARLVRCLLGRTAISDKKMDHGNPLVILGVEAKILEEGMRCRPSRDKAEKWSLHLQTAKSAKKLYSGEASKVCGRLQWAASRTFKRIGRAMLRPFFAQIRRRLPDVDPQLDLAMDWWIEVLQKGISERRE